MKKAIGTGLIISGFALLVAMAAAGAAENRPTETHNSVVSTDAPKVAIIDFGSPSEG